ncbi:hypothetical protein DR046_08875 [Jannaschia formosa]|nr:hypothetical protein DR046_08875 [Jannaschia formosa]
MEVRTGDPFDLDRVEMTVAARAVTLAPDCLPPDAGPVAAMLGPEGLYLPEAVLDLVYDMPSASMRARLSTSLEGVLAATVDADFDYVTLWAGDGADDPEGDGEEPEPEPELSGDLGAASLTLENLGGWEMARGFLPPPFTDPNSAGAAMTQALSASLSQQAEGGVLPKHGKTFVTEVAQGWATFVAEPTRLVIETGFPASEPLFLDPASFEGSPLDLIELLMPVVRQVPSAERAALAPDLVAQAITAPDTLPAEQRRAVGLALLTGEGAPRAVQRGIGLLSDLPEQDGEVMLAMAEAVAASAPEDAYGAALLAGRDAAPGARAVLDRLERELDFVTRIRIQGSHTPVPDRNALTAPVRELAARAQAHYSGIGAVRSLRAATLYASLAAARGDGGAARLLERIDAAIPEKDAATWAAISEEVAEVALSAWTGGTE